MWLSTGTAPRLRSETKAVAAQPEAIESPTTMAHRVALRSVRMRAGAKAAARISAPMPMPMAIGERPDPPASKWAKPAGVSVAQSPSGKMITRSAAKGPEITE